MERIVGFNHEVLLGVRDYAGPTKGWVCHFIDPRINLLTLVKEWEPHGIIAFLGNEEVARGVVDLGTPFVDVAAWVPKPSWPQVGFDDEAIGRLAADYFLNLGFENYAYIGDANLAFSDARRYGYEKALGEAGYRIRKFSADPQRFPPARGWTMGGSDGELVSWISALPKPIALFTENDERALLASEACRAGGVVIPGDVAILGVDDDPYLCGLGFPPLSSIATPARRLGYDAASVLDRLIQGFSVPREVLRLPPIQVVERRSTNSVAYGNPLVAESVRFIRANAIQGIEVEDVVAQIPVSRRTLERLFETIVGRSILTEINRVRLQHARALLATTDDSLKDVASQSGFRSQAWLATSHRNTFGTTPLEYRRSVRGAS